MATNAAELIAVRSGDRTFGRFADRWIFVFMAGLFVVVALLGFVPDSFGVIAAVRTGQHPPILPILHVHAVLMGSWLLLLLAQSVLMAVGRPSLHVKLGLVSVVLLPAIVVAGIVLVYTSWHVVWALAAAPPPGLNPAVLVPVKLIQTNVLLGQIRAAILFPAFVILALLLRRRDSGSHKRLMFLATAMPLAAGIDRFTSLLGLTHQPGSPILDLYVLAVLLPLFAYDLIRRGQLHRASVLWLVVNIPFAVALSLLFNSPWWIAMAPKVMGMQHW